MLCTDWRRAGTIKAVTRVIARRMHIIVKIKLVIRIVLSDGLCFLLTNIFLMIFSVPQTGTLMNNASIAPTITGIIKDRRVLAILITDEKFIKIAKINAPHITSIRFCFNFLSIVKKTVSLLQYFSRL